MKLTAKCVIIYVTNYHLTASARTVIHIIISLHINPTKMHFANKTFAVGGQEFCLHDTGLEARRNRDISRISAARKGSSHL